MRAVAVAVVAGLFTWAIAAGASAAPIFSLVFTGTTGSGTTGASIIDAMAGDTVTLDVLLDPNGETATTGWDFDLLGTGVTGVSGQECPSGSTLGSLSNLSDGLCSLGVGFIQPIVLGVQVSGSDVLNFDAGTIPPLSFSGATVWVGRAVFTITGEIFIELTGLYGLADFSQIPVHAATIPEPTTLGLTALGLVALGCVGRRRSDPSFCGRAEQTGPIRATQEEQK